VQWNPNERLLLDCHSPYVAAAIGLIVEDEISITEETDFCKESNSSNNPNMQTLNEIYNISQFANKKKYLVKCILNIDIEDAQREISFWYEVRNKRISNIDKNFQE